MGKVQDRSEGKEGKEAQRECVEVRSGSMDGIESWDVRRGRVEEKVEEQGIGESGKAGNANCVTMCISSRATYR